MKAMKGICTACGQATGSSRRAVCPGCLVQRKRAGGHKGGSAPKERSLSEDEVRRLLEEGERKSWNFAPGWRSRRDPE